MKRRVLLGTGLAAIAGVAALRIGFAGPENSPDGHATTQGFAVEKSDSEWRDELDPAAYRVLRKAGTEPAGSSPLNAIKDAGEFRCAGCDQTLFVSATKFESGTGWPSFYDYVDGALAFKTDYKMIIPRREYHCSNCGGHQGHVFKDGPQPTGLRYCNNGVALAFVPDTTTG